MSAKKAFFCCIVTILAFGLPTHSSHADTTLYRNQSGVNFNSSLNPTNVLDSMTISGFTPGMKLTKINLAYRVLTAGAGNIATVTFWDTVDTASDPINLNKLSSVSLTLNTATTGYRATGLVDISDADIYLNDSDLAVQVSYSIGVTQVFAGGGVGVGASSDSYWNDENVDGAFQSSELRNFGGTPYLANFFLELQGVPPVLPEPGVANLLVLGLPFLAARGVLGRNRAYVSGIGIKPSFRSPYHESDQCNPSRLR